MKSLLAVVCVLIALGFPVRASGQKIRKETIESQGKKRVYYLVVPDQATAEHPAPLLLLLHGSGRNGLSLVEKWKDLATKEGIILVGPDAINSQGWSSPVDGPDFLHDLISDLKSKYSIDSRRMYLFGHSAGATFALFMPERSITMMGRSSSGRRARFPFIFRWEQSISFSRSLRCEPPAMF